MTVSQRESCEWFWCLHSSCFESRITDLDDNRETRLVSALEEFLRDSLLRWTPHNPLLANLPHRRAVWSLVATAIRLPDGAKTTSPLLAQGYEPEQPTLWIMQL